MKTKYLTILAVIIFAFVFQSNHAFAQDKTHEAAMSMLTDFFSDPSARADYASKNPAALQAEQDLSQFPPNIQKKLENIVLIIMQESGANAIKHVEAGKISGPEGAFNSFSPAVQKEIQNIARELENDP
ncbi:MAG TPA: hypothetical protein VJZ49_11055 [Syntrophales bacterium]|nr:hypothetical protein [Syntrophales bacterium]